MSKWILVFLSPVFVWAAQNDCGAYQLKASAKNENAKFREFLKTDWDLFMRENPEWGSDLGYKDLAGIWSDDSLQGIAKRHARLVCASKAFKNIKRAQLNAENKTHYDLYQNRISMALEGWTFREHLMPLSQMEGVHTAIVDTLVSMPSQTREDFDNKLKRLKSANVKIQQHRVLLEEGLKAGLVPPRIVLKGVPQQFDTLLTKSVDDSGLFEAFKNVSTLTPEDGKAVQAEARAVIEKTLYPELESFKKFLVEKYLPGCRETLSIQALTNGPAWYDWSVRRHTTTMMKPEEIHQIGVNEVKRILAEMNGIKEKVKF